MKIAATAAAAVTRLKTATENCDDKYKTKKKKEQKHSFLTKKFSLHIWCNALQTNCLRLHSCSGDDYGEWCVCNMHCMYMKKRCEWIRKCVVLNYSRRWSRPLHFQLSLTFSFSWWTKTIYFHHAKPTKKNLYSIFFPFGILCLLYSSFWLCQTNAISRFNIKYEQEKKKCVQWN